MMKALPVLDPKAAAIDVGSEKLQVSIAGDTPKVFGTFTGAWEALRDWKPQAWKWWWSMAILPFNRGWNHLLVGAVLLLFGASHILALGIPRLSDDYTNLVFPFASNRMVYLFAGIYELVIAGICILKKGRENANVAVLVFIISMLWYRWALYEYFDAHEDCGCTGLLARLLKVTPAQNRWIPIIALIFLSVSILPWLFWSLRGIARAIFRKKALCVLTCMFVSTSYPLYGEDTIELGGTYDVDYFAPRTGDLLAKFSRHAAFVCTFSGESWSIFATNIATEGEGLKTPWEGLINDGKNIYQLLPNYRDTHEVDYPVGAVVSYGPVYVRDFDECLDFYILWVAFGLSPKAIPPNTNGVVDIPVPWVRSRESALAYGFEWKIDPSPEGRFVSSAQVLRNTNLDLSIEQEMRRPNTDISDSIENRNSYTGSFRLKQAMKPHGFKEAEYRVTDWVETNGVAIPAKSELTRFSNKVQTNAIARAYITVSRMEVKQGLQELLAPVQERTHVVDYRYTHGWLEYVMSRGDPWKSDQDPKLKQLDQAPPPLDTGSRQRNRNLFVWTILVITLALPVILLKTKLKPKSNETK